MDRETRIEENEKLFREVNERVAQLQPDLRPGPDPQWICECGDETCFEKVTVPLEAYREIRAHETWFLIRPGHDAPDVERVVQQHDGFAVVEKDGL